MVQPFSNPFDCAWIVGACDTLYYSCYIINFRKYSIHKKLDLDYWFESKSTYEDI